MTFKYVIDEALAEIRVDGWSGRQSGVGFDVRQHHVIHHPERGHQLGAGALG